MKLSDLVAAFMEERPAFLVVSEERVMAQLRRAVRFYCGYAALKNADLAADELHTDVTVANDAQAAQDFDLTPSEWSIIKPLFWLYVERDCASAIEASRGLGVDVFGRMTSEIAQDINLREQEMAKLAFVEPVFTV